ncbi:hypothetical protein Ddye_008443 [Dipteronia dyeriana]|uniref:Endonuclease/exonuclease/phosphatase domain-containing protein n=1 Tax=Dipteronia dyeriana TaxID=168575 RepID=A0AAE0CLD6_9ROSI|nr:hypothetical protein Ddye_008443 [Dipteronia dyeriana]
MLGKRTSKTRSIPFGIGDAWNPKSFGTMKIVSWNVWGLGNPRTFMALRKVLKKHSPSLVFLSETKLRGRKVISLKRQLGFEGCFQVDCVGRSGGLLLLWKEEWVVSMLSFSLGHIDAWICEGCGP